MSEEITGGERLYTAITHIEDGMIDAALDTRPLKKTHWKRRAAIAAGICLIAGAFFLSPLNPLRGASSGINIPTGGLGGGAGGSGHDEASTFMSYAGPVMPLTLSEADGDITAERHITLDFAPWEKVWLSNEAAAEDVDEEYRQEALADYNEWYPEGGRWESSSDIIVTDEYVLKNASDNEKTLTVMYPYVSDLMSAGSDMPVITADGKALEGEIIYGGYAGGFTGTSAEDAERSLNLDTPHSWEEYSALLTGGGYLADALDGFEDVSDIPAVVYKFTDAYANDPTAPNPSVRVWFRMDYDRTTVISYGFHAGSMDGESGVMGQGFSIREPGEHGYGIPYYLIVVGDDIRDMDISACVTGGWDRQKEIEDFSVHTERYETDLDTALREAADYMRQDRLETYREENESVDFETYYGALTDHLTKYGVLSDACRDRYFTGWLQDLDFETVDRICWVRCEITVPAGGEAAVSAQMRKRASFDFCCGQRENRDLNGYDMLTSAGSKLLCTGQTAELLDRGQIEIIRQSFGFDIEKGIKTVTLDPEEAHYFLEVRRSSN